MTALVVFDIEAVPDFEMARRLLEQPADTPDADIRRMLGQRYSRDGADPATAFLKAPIYRIASIAALYAKREDGGGPWAVTQIGSRSVDEKAEAELLASFVKSLPVDGRGTGPILVTFGGNGGVLIPFKFTVDIAEVRTAEGKLYMFVAIDRTSKFAFVELHERATTQTAADFLDALIKAVPYKIHPVLTATEFISLTRPAKLGARRRSRKCSPRDDDSARTPSSSHAPATTSTIG